MAALEAAASTASWFTPLKIAQLAAMGIGGIGDFFFDDPNEKYIDELLGQYRKLAKEGVGVGKLAAPEVSAINQAEERTVSDQSRMFNQAGMAGTSAAIQAPLGVRETFAAKKGTAFRSAEARNEEIKRRAMAMIPGLLGMRPDLSEGFGNLSAAGVSGALRGTLNSNNTNRQSQIGEGTRNLVATPTPGATAQTQPNRLLGAAGFGSRRPRGPYDDMYIQ